MVTLTNTFRAAMEQHREQRIYLSVGGGDVILSNRDIAATQGVEITEMMNPEEDLTVGKTPSSQFTAGIMNPDMMYSGVDFTQEIEIYLGVHTYSRRFNARGTSELNPAGDDDELGLCFYDVRYKTFYCAYYIKSLDKMTIFKLSISSSANLSAKQQNFTEIRCSGIETETKPDIIKAYSTDGNKVCALVASGRSAYTVLEDGSLGKAYKINESGTGYTTSDAPQPNDIQRAQLLRIIKDKRCVNVNLTATPDPQEVCAECYMSDGYVHFEEYETVRLGVFRGEKPERVKVNIINLTGYDRMYAMDKLADDFFDSVSYPTTLSGIVSSLLWRYSAGGDLNTPPSVNGQKTFSSAPVQTQGMTARDILAWAAEASASYCVYNHNGDMDFRWFGTAKRTADHMIPKTKRFSLSVAEYEVPRITGVKVHVSAADLGVDAGTSKNMYEIVDNPFLYGVSTDEIQPYVINILDRLQTIESYAPVLVRCKYNGATEVGDIMTVEDDDGKLIDFPVFMQTITWNGVAKVTYECTGNQSRKGLTTTQKQKLSAGHASHEWEVTLENFRSRIENAEGTVSEVAQTADKINWLVQSGTSASNFKMTPRAIQLLSESIQITASGGGFPGKVTVGSVSGASYGFTLSSDWYYTSTNKGDQGNNTYSICRVNITGITEAATLTLRCINYAETNFDYGVIGKLGKSLSSTIDDTNDVIYKSFKGESSPDPVDIDIPITQEDIAQGNTYFYIKYRKDSSQSYNDDAFKFKVSENTGTSTISLTRDGIVFSSATLKISGVVTFEDLSTAGQTVINGANITTGKISADRIDTSELYAKQIRINSNASIATVFTSQIVANANVYITIGVDFESGNYEGLNTSYNYRTEMLGSEIVFRDNERNNYLWFDIKRRSIELDSYNTWTLGTEARPFHGIYSQRFYFSDGSYLRVYSGHLRWYETDDNFVNLT